MNKDRKMILHRVTKKSINRHPFICIYGLESSSMSYEQGTNRNKISLRLRLDDAKSLVQGINELLVLDDKAEQRTEIKWCHNIGSNL